MKTLRELELEAQVAQLERRVYELSSQLGVMPKVTANEPELIELSGPIPTEFRAIVDCEYAADPIHGWAIRVTGHPNSAAWRFNYRYMVSEPWNVGREHIAYLLDREHQHFQLVLLNRVAPAKKRADALTS